MPAASSVEMSSVEATPPLAIRCSCGYAAMMRRYSSVAGPLSVPSLLISVQSTLQTPWSIYRRRKGSKSSCESSFHPLMLIFPFLTSAPKINLSAPYLSIHDRKRSGWVTAMLPTVTIEAPARNAFSRSSSVFIPPPKSTTKPVASVMARKTWSLTTCFDFAPSRSTT